MNATMRWGVNKLLVAWRQQKNYSQKELAEVISISAKSYWNYENGYRMPPVHVLFALEEVLEIPIRKIYDSFSHCQGYVNLDEVIEAKKLKREVTI